MCFAPAISLTTALIEFALATILLLFFPKTRLRNFFAFFIYWLGAYQLSEFFTCTTNYSLFWAGVGVFIYTFLPAFGLHGVLKIFKRKASLFLIYLVPVAVTIALVNIPGFVKSAQCLPFFVSVETMIFQVGSFWSYLYFFIYSVVYYFGFVVIAGIVILQSYLKEREKTRKKIDILVFASVLFMILSMLVLSVIFPAFGISTQSLLCEVAIVVAILSFIAAYLETRLKKEFSR